MKDYIFQFYNEGLATTFYLKPIKWVNRSIKNKKIVDIISIFIKIFYTILVVLFAIFIFKKKWPL